MDNNKNKKLIQFSVSLIFIISFYCLLQFSDIKNTASI